MSWVRTRPPGGEHRLFAPGEHPGLLAAPFLQLGEQPQHVVAVRRGAQPEVLVDCQ
ncbi:hypothetical protein ACQP1K_16705 [Sphaerimonospora sp. CA-214678]|uniref:hypothetical protein n=1 Tax=Sphaerimonospora sp. CA-214678 TaxID=3240029 RepID=UPI003D8B9D28